MSTPNVVDSYGWNSDENPQSCGYIGPHVIKLLKRLGVRRVLDLGSGNGVLCGALAKDGFDVVGVEYDAGGVAISRGAYPSIPFYCYGVQDDPKKILAQELEFQAVVSTEVVEHLFSPHLLPQYAAGVLMSGGYLVITTPYHGYLKNLLLSIFDKWDKHHTALWHGGHIKFWSRKSLSKLLVDNGFEVVGFSGVGRLPWLWKSMVLVAKKVD